MGRFISEDPIGLNGGLNVYGYVEGSPINYSDPFGLHAIPFSEPGRGLGLTARGGALGLSAYVGWQAGTGVSKGYEMMRGEGHTIGSDIYDLLYPNEYGDLVGPTSMDMAKGGRRRLENEYSREAKMRGGDICSWLAEQYRNAPNSIERNKIKSAQKEFGCRRNSQRDNCK
jgi:uncharacterized protein RhaS with RHS repeats